MQFLLFLTAQGWGASSCRSSSSCDARPGPKSLTCRLSCRWPLRSASQRRGHCPCPRRLCASCVLGRLREQTRPAFGLRASLPAPSAERRIGSSSASSASVSPQSSVVTRRTRPFAASSTSHGPSSRRGGRTSRSPRGACSTSASPTGRPSLPGGCSLPACVATSARQGGRGFSFGSRSAPPPRLALPPPRASGRPSPSRPQVLFARPFPAFSGRLNAWVTSWAAQWLMGPCSLEGLAPEDLSELVVLMLSLF